MSEYIVTVPKRHFNQMEDNPSYTRSNSNSNCPKKAL